MYIARSVQEMYAMAIGAVLVLVGLLGFFPNPLVGTAAGYTVSSTNPLFGANTAENILHIVVGALGLWFGYSGSAKGFNMGLGVGALVVGVAGLSFVPSLPDLLLSVFSINNYITYLHIVIGLVSLGVAYGLKK